jgi:hypothetical protein
MKAIDWAMIVTWSPVENAFRGRIPETELASTLNVRDFGRPGTPEEIRRLAATMPPSARLSTENLDREACGTPRHTPWYSHPTTFELVALVVLMALMIWWW